MSDCCGPEGCETPAGKSEGQKTCPECKQKGGKVQSQTPRAMLTQEGMKNLKNVEYRFCATADCPVVYFGEESVFHKADIRTAVTQKEDAGNTPVCYCYGHTKASIEEDVKNGGTGPAAQIAGFVKKGLCACDVRNPQGTCCLGNVAAVVKGVKAQVNAAG